MQGSSIETGLRGVAPVELVRAREVVHAAAQMLARAGFANVDPLPGDEHSNLGWDALLACLTTHEMTGSGGRLRVGLDPAAPSLLMLREEEVAADFALSGATAAEAAAWLDAQLSDAGLAAASAVTLPYELPESIVSLDRFDTAGLEAACKTLAAWFAFAAAHFDSFAARHGDLQPGPSAVRCWPHHFDIATYVSLESGDPEAARGVGVGLSPGDETYPQPYFYITPYPQPDASNLPDAPMPGHWQRDAFVGLIATGEEISSLSALEEQTGAFIEQAFTIAYALTGA